MNIVIIGAGDIGYNLAKKLIPEKHNISIIELDHSRFKRANDNLDALVIEGSGSSLKSLSEANINEAHILVAISNSDETNLLACQIAKKIGVPLTLARVKNSEFLSSDFVLSKSELGVDYLIQPEIVTTKAIVRLIRQANATDMLELENGNLLIVGLRLDKKAEILDIPLSELGKKFGNPPINIVAIKRRLFTIIPRGNDRLLNTDQIFVMLHRDYLPEALQLLGKSEKNLTNIMIVGGGTIGKYIAKELEDTINIKIIEKDERKAEQLAAELKSTLVINGDGSDLDLLAYEGITDMDEFVAVTGDDEINIITCLVANHLKVQRTIALIKKSEYTSLMPAIGIHSVVSKQLITVNTIQKFIRSSQLSYYAEIPGIDAEIFEFNANAKSKIINKQIKDLNFPKNAIIGAIVKKGSEIVIPKGNSIIEIGDKVVVLAMPSAIKDVERFF